MVGIVVVSHSRILARAAVALAEEMLQGRSVPIVIAAGLDEETFGTDAVQIAEALAEADRDGDGVVVLMDLGSAVLSAELALELLTDDDARRRVVLCPAPLVEGLVVAAVTALSGAGRDEVAAEARAALAGKQSQLAPDPVAAVLTISPQIAENTTPGPLLDGESDVVSGWFPVTPDHGLHARPAARLVQALQGLQARVELRNRTTESGWVPGASLSRLATLGALRGHDVEVRATGPQAGEAVQRLLALAQRNFDEHGRSDAGPPGGGIQVAQQQETTDEWTPEPVGGPFPASPGIGIGPAQQVGASAAKPTTEGDTKEDQEEPAQARRRLDQAIDSVRTQVQQIRTRVAHDVGESEAAIFDAHLALLADPELLESARSRISAGQAAVGAWANAVSVAAAGYESLTDPYQQARAADVRALGNQVSRQLLTRPAERPAVPAGPSAIGEFLEDSEYSETGQYSETSQYSGVLVAGDLSPTEAAMLDPERVVAVVLAYGSPSAHSAILIRARGIPAVVAAGTEVLDIADGTRLAVDGGTGDLVIDPPESVVSGFRGRAAAARERERQAEARSGAPAITRDGVGIPVGANVGSMAEAHAAATSGADLIGLVRTEFLFLGRTRAPDVDEQEAAYRGLAEAAGSRLTLRTLDVGGDKPVAYLPQRPETNPFLGVRGLRLSLEHPDLLADQLLAMVTVAHDVPVSIMFPMVSTLDELLSGRRILDEAIKRAGRGQPGGLEVGIMIEVPAAALKAAVFASYVDFFSIGTNDLTQYALAADRGNDATARIADPLDPGVLRLIDATCRGAGPGTTVAVCGELAADDQAVGILLGLGVRELSVTPRAVPGIKQAVRAQALPQIEALAARALEAPSAAAVRAMLRSTHIASRVSDTE